MRLRTALIACAGLLLLAAGPTPVARGELVVRNLSFSSLEISVLTGATETRLGGAPPEFTNTLYFPVGDETGSLRFRARLQGAPEVLHESRPLQVIPGMRVRWTLPENRLEPLREHAAGLAATR